MSEDAKGPSAVKADKNPSGGLSAKGRAKFGVQAGVKNYSSASRKDKGRWVSWAMRFTGSPKPVKDAKGNPTRYALMFRAWGEPVPTSREAVQAVHAKAVKRSKELKNADKASFADLTDDFAEDLACSDCDREFLLFANMLDHIETAHLGETTERAERPTNTEEAQVAHTCPNENCDRSFLSEELLADHAEATHTFSDIEELVRDKVRDTYNREGDYRASPPITSIYAWVRDLSTDWVVFEVNDRDKGTLYKASYSITDGVVTLGERTEVVRKTVYEAVSTSTATTTPDAASAAAVKIGAHYYEDVA